jgi:hypothetical protein
VDTFPPGDDNLQQFKGFLATLCIERLEREVPELCVVVSSVELRDSIEIITWLPKRYSVLELS